MATYENTVLLDQTAARVPRSRPRSHCYLCGASGMPLYKNLSDRVWTVPGVWDVLQCSRPSCGLAWLDPCPIDEDIPLLYENYFTHSDQSVRARTRIELLKRKILGNVYGRKGEQGDSLLGRSLAWFSVSRDYAEGSILWLEPAWRGSLLDIGAGGGELLSRARDLGWDGFGVEQDVKARESVKKELGLELRPSSQDFPDSSFDVVTLSHVIEHVPEPLSMIRECGRLLKPGGRLIIATPNIDSLGHSWFGEKWFALEPPRHVMLFTPKTLKVCIEKAGLEVETVRTSARSAFFVWYGSQLLKSGRKKNGGAVQHSEAGFVMKLAGSIFHFVEHYFVKGHRGEEVVLVARKA